MFSDEVTRASRTSILVRLGRALEGSVAYVDYDEGHHILYGSADQTLWRLLID
ncbi:MAG TPA: hypothetical protein VGP93_21165 [Polyangiaceae bacterium]|nr:hypothetical protein [Polyangiaceae bacterium]